MGEWEGGGPQEEVGGEERKNGGLNRGKLPSFDRQQEGEERWDHGLFNDGGKGVVVGAWHLWGSI